MLKGTKGDVCTDAANEKQGVGKKMRGIQTCTRFQGLVLINNIVNSVSDTAARNIGEITSPFRGLLVRCDC